MTYRFVIDPERESSRDTLCQNLRLLHRRLAAAGDAEGLAIVAAAFNQAKRMDARLKYYRGTYEPWRVGPEIKDGNPDEPD